MRFRPTNIEDIRHVCRGCLYTKKCIYMKPHPKDTSADPEKVIDIEFNDFGEMYDKCKIIKHMSDENTVYNSETKISFSKKK